ncbi:MAG: AcrR family transcriptional regulator [Cognaticolwellia sp.]|jgi:AcrR family transcriptional regulator
MTQTQQRHTSHDDIVNVAIQQAAQSGLDGLSIGGLAKSVGLSKSGLFGHFGSKQGLQIEVLNACHARFIQQVVQPAVSLENPLARLRALLENWLDWAGQSDGGCLFVATATEFDDRPGPVRDQVRAASFDWVQTLERAVSVAVKGGDLNPATSDKQFAFELHGLMLSYHCRKRLIESDQARVMAKAAFGRLLHSYEA